MNCVSPGFGCVSVSIITDIKHVPSSQVVTPQLPSLVGWLQYDAGIAVMPFATVRATSASSKQCTLFVQQIIPNFRVPITGGGTRYELKLMK